MSPQPTELTTRELRARLADVIHAAAVEGRTTFITSRGRRVAAVVPLGVVEVATQPEAPDSGASVV